MGLYRPTDVMNLGRPVNAQKKTRRDDACVSAVGSDYSDGRNGNRYSTKRQRLASHINSNPSRLPKPSGQKRMSNGYVDVITLDDSENESDVEVPAVSISYETYEKDGEKSETLSHMTKKLKSDVGKEIYISSSDVPSHTVCNRSEQIGTLEFSHVDEDSPETLSYQRKKGQLIGGCIIARKGQSEESEGTLSDDICAGSDERKGTNKIAVTETENRKAPSLREPISDADGTFRKAKEPPDVNGTIVNDRERSMNAPIETEYVEDVNSAIVMNPNNANMMLDPHAQAYMYYYPYYNYYMSQMNWNGSAQAPPTNGEPVTPIPNSNSNITVSPATPSKCTPELIQPEPVTTEPVTTRMDYVSKIHTLVQTGKLKNVLFTYEEEQSSKTQCWSCEVEGKKAPFSNSDVIIGIGRGRSQKIAKQLAAQKFWDRM